MLNKLLWLLILPALLSCKIAKEALSRETGPAVAMSPAVSKDALFDDIIARQANFNTLSIRAKANLEIDGDENNVVMTIRIQKDKAIWISVTAVAGVEIARTLITPDSLKILNRVENTYTKKPFDYIYEFTSERLNFNTLQSILAGNAMPEFLNDRSTVNVSGKTSIVSGALDNLVYALTFNENLRLAETSLKDDSAKQSLSVIYRDFSLFSQQMIPQSVAIKSDSEDKNIAIDLKYTRVNVNVSVDLPFSVPQRFKVIN